MPFNVMLREVM